MQVALDRRQGNAQLAGDLALAQAIDLGQQEGAFDQRRQAIEQAVELEQRVQDEGFVFLAGRHLLGLLGQGLEVGAFQFLAAEVVAQHALGHGGEEGPGLDQLRRLAGLEQAQVGVLGQVGGALRAAQASSQPSGQPTVMGVVETFDGGREGTGHRYDSGARRRNWK